MVAMAGVDLTEDEAELYDRQIRLWGFESQKRLRTSKILIIGVGGLGAEIAKNIILTGVNSVTLLDSGVVTKEDTYCQFLVPTESIGRNRAEASVSRARALNPMVNVTADTEELSHKSDEYLGGFDVVLATGCSLKELVKINNVCRKKDVLFFCGDVIGMFGFGFADLLTHNYMAEVLSYTASKVPITSFAPGNIKYVPLADAISWDWSDPKLAKRLKKMDYAFFLLLVLFEFEKQHNRLPDRLQRESDIARLKKLSSTLLPGFNVQSSKIPDEIYGSLFAEVSPVCAIVGGILAQDVIRAISQKEKPLHNFIFFDPIKCYAYVETVEK